MKEMEKNADAFIALPGKFLIKDKSKHPITLLPFTVQKVFNILLSRWLWNHGRNFRNGSLVPVWNS